MEMEISCLTRNGRGIKNCFCLHGIFTGNVSAIWNKCDIAFYNKFWNQLGKSFKHFCFFTFGIWKNGGFTFLICYFLKINIYCFLDLLLFRWSWYMVTALGIFLMICQVSTIFERLFSSYFVVPISHTKKIRKKSTHTHYSHVFLWKTMGKSFS